MEGIPLFLSSFSSIVVRRASWFPLEYSLLDTLFMIFYSYSNMFLGCLVSLLNLCKLRYCDMELCLFPPSYIPRPLMYSPMYADCVSWVSLGVRQIVISGQGISTISTQYAPISRYSFSYQQNILISASDAREFLFAKFDSVSYNQFLK